MNLIVQIPLEVRLAALFLGGAVVAGQLNRAIYCLAFQARAMGPWSWPPAEAPPRRWSDRLPIIGWWGLRRESPWHGRGYWVRPLLLEVSVGAGLALLYWLETEQRWLWPALPGAAPPDSWIVHAQFVSHAILIALMIVATFIDLDEQTIPDEITVNGTVVALLIAAALPPSLLPDVHEPLAGAASYHHLVLTSSTTAESRWLDGLGGPSSWPPLLQGPAGLLLGLAGVWLWCFAILHKTWTLRQGVLRGVRFLVASVIRHRTWPVPLGLGLLLSTLTLAIWGLAALDPRTVSWQSLLTAIVGMCFGGGLIWAVRIISGHALGVEAMGFGDVTLMAMIGAFLGWQAAFLVFFLAPLTALVIAAAQWFLTGQRQIAFGPYLCLAALIVLISWDAVWNQWARPMFSLGWFIPAILACCLVLMGGLLWLWRVVREACWGDPARREETDVPV